MKPEPQLRLPGAGELAPDFSLLDSAGRPVHLRDYPRPLALVFLRHLA